MASAGKRFHFYVGADKFGPEETTDTPQDYSLVINDQHPRARHHEIRTDRRKLSLCWSYPGKRGGFQSFE